MNWKTWTLPGLIVLSGLVLVGCKLTRAGYESARYTVVRKSGAFEIRDYPDTVVVSAPMNAAQDGGDDGFRQLFGYISGGNEAEQKIAMTTPVFSDPGNTNATMSFVVPVKVASSGAPKPRESNLRLETRAGGSFAVHRYSGGWSEERAAGARRKLAEWMAAEKLVPAGPAEVANYDPPFTPAFLRRNEVLMRIQGE